MFGLSYKLGMDKKGKEEKPLSPRVVSACKTRANPIQPFTHFSDVNKMPEMPIISLRFMYQMNTLCYCIQSIKTNENSEM